VIAHQRRRLLSAVPAAVSAKGYLALTVEDICAHAGVSRRTFYENFRDKEDCFITSYRQHADELIAAVAAAISVGDDWQERARFALGALLGFLARRPAISRMAVIEVMAAGPAAIEERDRVVAMLSSLIGEGALGLVPDPAPAVWRRAVAGAALELIYERVLDGRGRELEELQPTLTYLALVAQHGPAVAAVKAKLLPDRRRSR
jgi:AcrR family transcriptional regulator